MLAGLLVAGILFRGRGVLAVLATLRQRREGDYQGALRRMRWISLGIPDARVLHAQGLTLAMAGQTREAERRYRTALALARGSAYPRERLQACLGYALMDLEQYQDAEQCFHRAIEAGDHSGNSQDGLAELHLRQGDDPAGALNYAQQAIQHARRSPQGRIPAAYLAHQAWALALLDRREEASEVLDAALRPTPGTAPERSGLRWRVGMALLAMHQPERAREQFQIGLEKDPQGKYGRRCEEMLRQHQMV